MEEYYPELICTDCALIIANDDDSGMDEATMNRVRLALLEWRDDYGQGWIVGPVYGFSLSACECCDSWFVGDRFTAGRFNY